MKPKPQRSVEEIREASRHLHYEVEMLKWTAVRLADTGNLPEPEVNALLESFTIHARALHYFFYEPRKRDDDVVADDFMPIPLVWSVLAGPLPTALVDIRKRVGTEIAHLSYGRLSLSVTPEAKLWNITAITEALLTGVDLFEQHAENLATIWGSISTRDVLKLPLTATGTNSPIMVNSIAPQKIIGAND